MFLVFRFSFLPLVVLTLFLQFVYPAKVLGFMKLMSQKVGAIIRVANGDLFSLFYLFVLLAARAAL